MKTTQQEREKRKEQGVKIRLYETIETVCDKIHYEDFDHVRVFTHHPNDEELLKFGEAIAGILYE